MSSLTSRTIAASYLELLKTASAAGVTSVLTAIEDGDATASALQISTTGIQSSGTLNVVGPTTLTSTLIVSGASTLIGNVGITGDLNVTGNAVIDGLLTANGGTLTFGNADTDNVVFGADINSNILPNTDNTYDLGSAAKSWKDIYIDGTASINSLTITGSQTIPATTQSTNKDTGALVVEGGVGVEKNVNVGGNLAVTGTTALTGNTSVTGTLGVTGATNLSSTLGVTGATTLSSTLGVTGATTLSNTLGVSGATTLSSTLGVTGATTLSSTLGVSGAATLSSTLGVSDTISATKASGTGLAVTANATVGGDLTVTGNLTINGTTTNINTTNLVVEDKNVVLADVATPTNTTADGGGITLKGATDKTLNWVNSTSAWTSSENVDVATGKTYKINGTDVLSNNTLGSGVTASSLTSVGTIGTGTWQGTIINPTYGGTGVNNGSKTITLGGNLTTSGAFATTLASTANTNVTLPTTGTLATLANTETFTNKTLTSPVISSIVNTGTLTLPTSTDTLVGRATTDTLTNKTLTSPVISSISNTGTLTLPTSTDTLVGRTTTDTLTNKTLTSPVISSIVNTGTITLPTSNDTLVGRATTDTLTNKTLTTPVISSISNTGTITLPTSTDTLVGRATTDTLTNKTLTSPILVTPTLGAASATSLSLTNALSIANGGTGRTTAGSANTFVGVNAAGTALENKTLASGTGISISDVSGTVTITNTGGGGAGGGGSASGAVAIYRYNATAAQTVFSGVDTSTPPTTLVYTPNYLSVYLNGVKLDDSDFTATNGTSITLNVACVATDDVDVVAFGAVPQLASPGLANYVVSTNAAGTSLEYKQIIAGTGVSIAPGIGSLTISASGASPLSAPLASFRYIASANQTLFTGADTNGNTLLFTPGFFYVFINGILLAPILDYTTTGTGSITLVSGCSASDFVDILAFGQVTTIGIADNSVTYAKLDSTAKGTLTGKSIAMTIVFGG